MKRPINVGGGEAIYNGMVHCSIYAYHKKFGQGTLYVLLIIAVLFRKVGTTGSTRAIDSSTVRLCTCTPLL